LPTSRLTLAIDAGLAALPDSGDIAVFRASAASDLSRLPKDRVQVITGFYPDHQTFSARGFRTAVKADGQYAAAIVILPRAKALARGLIADAHLATSGGPVIIDGQKTDGVNSLLKECRAHGGGISGVFAKAHGRTFTLNGGDFSGWLNAEPSKIAGGFVTQAGVFSADGIDPGSAALVAALPEALPGKVADLGAGWGYLAHHILKRDVAECHLIEAEHDALTCARTNITDPRARFHWADAVAFDAETGFDHIITNPPFHAGRTADPGLGRGFITAAARLLSRRGQLWLVANRHLPYEQHLSATFNEVAQVAGDTSYKVFRASLARPPTG